MFLSSAITTNHLHINFVERNSVKIADQILPIGNSYKEDFIQKYTA